MTSLRELQILFRDAVFEGGNDSALPAFSEHVRATPGLSPSEHALIYRRAVIGTLVTAMGRIYPVVERLVGGQFFDAMARRYVRAAPSRTPDLAEYGGDFAEFLADFEPAATLPYLPDVARLEWAWHRAFNAPDEAPLDPAELATVPASDVPFLQFRLPASGHLLTSDYPVERIWQVNQDDWDGDQTVDLDAGGARLLVWRQGYEMRIDMLTPDEWWLLGAISRGESFGAIGNAPQAARLDELLPACVRRGWIAGLKLQKDTVSVSAGSDPASFNRR